jgi:DNA-binding CsgD family transcriptional regulator/tetratricopeptide (TPR) repeat protein
VGLEGSQLPGDRGEGERRGDRSASVRSMAMIDAMPRVSSPIFVGRTAELDRLCRALDRASSRQPSVVLIAGEAGIGKTRLMTEFSHRAREGGARVLIGGSMQVGETGLPYAPIVGALRPLLRSLPAERLDELLGAGRAELAHLVPDLGPAGRGSGRAHDGALTSAAYQARLFEVLLELMRRLAEERPLVLVLEDIHWADAASRDFVRFLAGNARGARLLVLATYRSDELHRRHALLPLIAELQRLEQVDEFELAAFGADEVAAQLAGITGEPVAGELVETVLARSGGNPFFAEELMATGQAGLALSRSLRDTLEARLRSLGAPAQHVLRVASVAGVQVDHRLLASVVELPEPELVEVLREPVEQHLLVPSAPGEAPGYAFRHALVHEVAYDGLLPSERTQLHAAFARSIEAHPGVRMDEPARTTALVAHHWLMAHDLARALRAAIEAGRAAAAGLAFAEARMYLERALELWPKVGPESLPPDVDRRTIVEEAAEAAVQAGDARRSIDLVRSALAETDAAAEPMRAGILHHRLAWYANEAGDWQAGVVALERAAELLPIDPPTRARARVLADLAHSLMIRGRFGESMALAEAALAVSRAADAPLAEARALNALGLSLASRSDFERALPMLRDGHARALALSDPIAIFLTAVGLGWTLDETGRHAEALELALAARTRIAHDGADARFGAHLASKASRALYELGRWDESAALISETLAASPTRYAVRWLLANRLRIHAGRGDLDGARADLDSYASLGERLIGPDPDLLGARRAELAVLAGTLTIAREIVRATLEQFVEPELDTDARSLLLIGLRAEAIEAEAARAAGDAHRVQAAVARGAELEQQVADHFARIDQLVAQPATILAADRDLAAALAGQIRGTAHPEAWDVAVAGRRSVGRPFEVASVLKFAAIGWLAARRRDDAMAALAEAHAIATDLGASPLRTRLEAIARRARVGLEGVATADDTADRLGLTRREREVLALLVGGRSNREIGDQLFMAESTAGVHVSNILGKLGVRRRHEAAVLAQRMGLGGS